MTPSLVLHRNDCAESILKPLLETKYFTRTLQRCSCFQKVQINKNLLRALSKVQSLTKLDLDLLDNEHLELIINSFPSLETLTISAAYRLEKRDPSKSSIRNISPPPPATKTLKNLALHYADSSFATQFVPNFPNLRKLVLFDHYTSHQELELLPLSSSLPFLTDLDLENFILKNTESLKNLVHLSTLQFRWCIISDLNFLTQENSLPHLTTLRINARDLISSSSFSSLSRAPNLRVLKLTRSNKFNNDCLHYLENMVHLRKLDLSYTSIVGDSRVFKKLMQNLFQLEELNLEYCPNIGHKGAIAGALYSTHSRLRVLNLSHCNLVDDDLNGISALKNTLEDVVLAGNQDLTQQALVHCKDLVKLKSLELQFCYHISDLFPLEGCPNLEDLDVSFCGGLTDDSFNVVSEEPNSFPNLSVLNLSSCDRLTEKVFEHLSKNNHLVHQLKELNVWGMSKILSSSATALNNICQLKGLRKLKGIPDSISSGTDQNKLKAEVMLRLKNLEDVD